MSLPSSIASSLSTSAFETLRLNIADEILTVTIARPKALNALSQQVISELTQVTEQLSRLGEVDDEGKADWSIRGVILTGDGEKSFVAGGDISEMSTMTPDDVRAYAGRAQTFTAHLEALPVPVIAAVNGFALGGGCEIALACDMIFASERALFGQPEVALGLIPGFGGTVRLQKAVGPQIAKDLILSARHITAQEAREYGLAARVYASQEELLSGATEYLELVKKQSPVAVAAAKRSVNATAHLSTLDGLQVELDFFADCFSTDDMREGTSAFVEKRKPSFNGR